MTKKYLTPVFFILAGCLLLAVPLLRDFHIESALLAGSVGCFWSAIRSAKHTTKEDFFPALRILGFLYLTALPLFLFSIFSGCLSLEGVGFWLLIPLPSVFFGTALGRLVRKFWVPFPKTLTVLLLLFISGGVWLIELINFPQVYFFNHVWGYWPGPIYDEAIRLNGSFLFFRWITFLWIVLLWVLPEWSKNLQTKLITGLTLAGLLLCYLNLDEMGIIAPNERIQDMLGGYYQTNHFNIYYNDDFYSQDEIDYWAKRHEFHFNQIVNELNIDWPSGRTVETYLYAHAWEKKKLTGAKFTSYVPVWLETDQLHIAKQQLDPVLKHELVHVISKQFGNNLFNASWSIGLIEGLAESLAGDASAQSTLDQIVASERPYPGPGQMKSALSISGFYTKASAISYTTSGSFVAYLLDNYPADYFKQSYPAADFDNHYPVSFNELVMGWHQHLDSTTIDSVDQRVSELIFARRSLFQKQCPHTISTDMKLWDRYQFHLANHDTIEAHQTLERLYSLSPANDLVLSEWVTVLLQNEEYGRALSSFTATDTLLTLQTIKADANMLASKYPSADSILNEIAPDIQTSPLRNFKYSLQLREDSVQWTYHVNRRYKNELPDSSVFMELNLPNKMLSVNRSLELKSDQELVSYSRLLKNTPVHEDWFDIYEPQIERLVYLGEFELAEQLFQKLSGIELRSRYKERLLELVEWLSFIERHP